MDRATCRSGLRPDKTEPIGWQRLRIRLGFVPSGHRPDLRLLQLIGSRLSGHGQVDDCCEQQHEGAGDQTPQSKRQGINAAAAIAPTSNMRSTVKRFPEVIRMASPIESTAPILRSIIRY